MIAKKEENIITIEFEEHRHIVAPALFQHNTGQVIKFNDVPDGAEVQFSNENSEKTTNKIVKDSQVEIPDFLVAKGLEITAYIQYVSETSETTVKIISILVEARVKQGEVVALEDKQTFREELQGIMNETKEAAKEAADKVEVNRKYLDEMEKKSTDTIENITSVGEAQINAINEVSKGKLSDINQTATSQIDALNRTAQAQIETLNNVAKQNINTETNSIVQAARAQIDGINNVADARIVGINQVARGQINAIIDTASRQISAINDTSTSQLNAINQTAQAQSKALQEQGDGLKYDLAVKEKHTIMLSAGAYSDLIDVNEYDAIQVNGISCNGTDTIGESLKLKVVKFKDGEQVGDEFLEKYNAIADLTDCDSIKLLVAYRGGTSDVATVWYTLIVWDAKKEIERYVERVEDAVLIKPTASGTEMVLNDSSNMNIQELHLFGKSEQTATTGAQLFNVKDKLNWNSVFSVDSEGWISAVIPANTGTTDIYYAFNTKKSDLLKPNTTYLAVMEFGMILLDKLSLMAISPDVSMGTTNIKSQFKGYTSFAKSTVTPVETINSFENSDCMCKGYIQAKPGFAGGSVKFRFSLIEDTSMTIDKFKYEAYTGGKASPNPDYPQEIKQIENLTVSVAGKNLFEPSTINYSYNNLRITANVDNSQKNSIKIKINTINATEGGLYAFAYMNINKFVKKIKSNTTYTIVLKNPQNINSVFVGTIIGTNRITNTVAVKSNVIKLQTINDTSNKSTYPLVFYFSGTVKENTIIGFDDIAVYEGEYPNAEIEEYKEIQTAQLTYELNGIDDVRDELVVKADGTGQLVQRIYSGIIQEKNTKELSGERMAIELKGYKAANNYYTNQTLCNLLAGTSQSNTLRDTNIICVNGENVYIRLNGKSSAEAIEWYQQNKENIKIIYPLDEPIITELSAEEVQKVLALHTYKPNSTIWNDQNADMEVTYVADAKNYIDNKFKELSDAIVASASEAE